MENILKKPYEISLWEDVLTYIVRDSNGVVHEYEGFIPEGEFGTTLSQYYKERKLCVIGSNIMDTPIRAVQGKLISNVNGSNTFSFSLYSKYWDQEVEEFYPNPFLKFMVNERKVKLRYGALDDPELKWYDLVIKDIKENSENKTFQYTCKDLFINELSKTGFEIELDTELENNMGTITELAATVLENSDWSVGASDIIVQTTEEPLYEIVLKESIKGADMRTDTVVQISKGQKIYAFYNIIANREPYFQFLYTSGNYKIDDDHVIINAPEGSNYYIENATYDANGQPTFAEEMKFSSEYRGDKLVRQAKTVFDSTIDKYVYVYNNGDIYGLETTEYVTPTAVENFITNSNGFSSLSGWKTGSAYDENALEYVFSQTTLVGFPDIRDIASEQIDSTTYYSFLKYKRTLDDQVLFNSGIADHRSALKSIAIDEKFTMRAKFFEGIATQEHLSGLILPSDSIDFEIGEYELDSNGKYILSKNGLYFSGTLTMPNKSNWTLENSGWASVDVTSLVSKSYTDLSEARIGIFFKTPLNKDIYFKEVQFYRHVTYERLIDEATPELGYETVPAEPGGELFSIARTKYTYYLPSSEYKSIDDLFPLYEGYEPSNQFTKVYNDEGNRFEKVRSITAKESNRFNLIQSLCETFECWARFEIEHDPLTGEIVMDENHRQKKTVSFHEYIGKDNYAGFKYGINLKSIQRTINSDGIVSKIIVKNNANEFAPNGFCSIARATENPSGENSIYEFNYYIQQGLLDFYQVNDDLYEESGGCLGYYAKLKRLNANREAWIDEQSQLLVDIPKYESDYQTYKIAVEEAEDQLAEKLQYVFDLTGFTYDRLLKDKNYVAPEEEGEEGEEVDEDETQLKEKTDEELILLWWSNQDLLNAMAAIGQLKAIIATNIPLRNEAKTKLDGANTDFDVLENKIKTLATQKREQDLLFYKKYSRFIQEGSWISEDYVDENLYYLDALSTLHTSAQPKTTYTINVLELSQLEGFENYRFALGDKTYMEDTEFFGWVWSADGLRTPYREEIIISEITIELDSPEKNTIKVQNFKTQFEDLFQRITATTQAVQFHQGEYGRATGIVDTNGTINTTVLQESLSNNAIKLENAKDQSVVWNESGITTTNLSNPSEVIRIIGGGVFVSNNGGETWSTGVTGEGINASLLTSGQINASTVNIMNGTYPSFRWDGKGLSAYHFKQDTTGKAYSYNPGKFVRFDQYGLYGIDGNENFDATIPTAGKEGENKIWDQAHFALTWNGFMLKNKYGSGYVAISSKDDFIVHDGTNTRIKIGKIGAKDDTNELIYGIRISNAEGKAVMETDDKGQLWLKDRLDVQTLEGYSVAIGNLGPAKADSGIGGNPVPGGSENQVINANNGFIVYEDGSIRANGGVIGNTTFEKIEAGIQSTKGIVVVKEKGTSFQIDKEETVTPTELEFRVVQKNIHIANSSQIIWEFSNQYEDSTGKVTGWDSTRAGLDISVSYNDLVFFKNICYLRVQATDDEQGKYTEYFTITRTFDGKNGEEPTLLTISSSTGNIYINNNVAATLTATVWKNNVDITNNYSHESFIWEKYDKNGIKVGDWNDYGPNIIIDGEDVEQKATFSCTLQLS